MNHLPTSPNNWWSTCIYKVCHAMHKLLTILCSYSCQDNSSLHYNWYCIYSKYWLLKLQSGYLGCRQADETVAISGFLVTIHVWHCKKYPTFVWLLRFQCFVNWWVVGNKHTLFVFLACMWTVRVRVFDRKHALFFSLHAWASLTIRVFHRNMHCSFSLWCMWTVKSHWLPLAYIMYIYQP